MKKILSDLEIDLAHHPHDQDIYDQNIGHKDLLEKILLSQCIIQWPSSSRLSKLPAGSLHG